MSDPVPTSRLPAENGNFEVASATGKPPSSMRKWLSLALRLLVSASLLGWLGWSTDWAQVGAAAANLRVEYWLAAAGLLLATQVVSSIRWKMFAGELRFRESVPRLTSYYLVGMFFNLFLPTSVGGDVVRAWYLDAGAGRRLAALASVLLDRLNGLVVLVMLACGGLCFSPSGLPRWVPLSVLGIAAGCVAGFIALPWIPRLSFISETKRRQFATVVAIIHHPRILLWTTSLSFVVQAANVLLVWFIGAGLGLEIPFAYYWVVVPMVSLLTLLPVSANGMGVREGGCVLFLAPVGVSAEAALTLAFLWFAVFVAASLVGGVAYLLVGRSARNVGELNDGYFDRNPDQGREGQLTEAA